MEDFLSDLRRFFSKGYHKIMEPIEASAKSTDPEEVIDLQDDHVVHRDDDVQPEPEQVLDDVLTNDIEKDPPPTKSKRPRTKAQQEAFKKAQTALKAKREKEKQQKAIQPKKARGRPAKRAPKKKKETTVVFEESSESDYSASESSSSEEEVVYVQRKKKSQPQKKPKKPKAPKVV